MSKKSNWSMDKFDLVIYTMSRQETYLHLIKENFKLINKLLKQRKKFLQPYDAGKKEIFYVAKAKHLQIMMLLGSTAEHLIKLVLLKRGFCINLTENYSKHKKGGICLDKFSSDFLKKLQKFNESKITQRKMNKIYLEAKKDINQKFQKNTAPFFACISTFKKSNKNFLKQVKEYKITNKKRQGFSGKRYLKKYSVLNKNNCLNAICDARNSYMHLAEAKEEQQGVFLYIYNYILCLGKEEFIDYFKDMGLIGSQDILKLFKGKKEIRGE